MPDDVDDRRNRIMTMENGVCFMGPSAQSIMELNIQHYLGLLQTEKDPIKRETIARLLEEEKEKLAALLNPPKE